MTCLVSAMLGKLIIAQDMRKVQPCDSELIQVIAVQLDAIRVDIGVSISP